MIIDKVKVEKSFSESGHHMGMLEVVYPDSSKWDIDAYERLKLSELDKIKGEADTYNRDEVFRQDPYFRYFRKFKQTYPVMKQVESFLLKDRPFGNNYPVNEVAFLTELKLHSLIGTHDADKMKGALTLDCPSEKEVFHSMRGQDTHVYPGEAVIRDEENIIASLINGADISTCLTDDSLHVIYFIFGTPGHDETMYEKSKEQLMVITNTLAPNAEIQYKLY